MKERFNWNRSNAIRILNNFNAIPWKKLIIQIPKYLNKINHFSLPTCFTQKGKANKFSETKIMYVLFHGIEYSKNKFIKYWAKLTRIFRIYVMFGVFQIIGYLKIKIMTYWGNRTSFKNIRLCWSFPTELFMVKEKSSIIDPL